MTPTSPAPTQVTVVHSSACHFCDDASAVLADVATQFPLTVELIASDDPRGRALVEHYRAAMYPLVLVDGLLFSSGRLPRKKLRALLEARAAAAVP